MAKKKTPIKTKEKTMTKKKGHISVTTIAEQYNKDPSSVHKDISKAEITTFKGVTASGKSCTAITYKDFEILKNQKAYKYSVLDKLPLGAVTLEQASKNLGVDKSGLQKKAKNLGLVLDKAHLIKGYKPRRFLTKCQLDILTTTFPAKVLAD